MNEQTKLNTLTGAEAMVRMLEANGVRHIFGLCGDTTLPFYDALFRGDGLGWRAEVTQDQTMGDPVTEIVVTPR